MAGVIVDIALVERVVSSSGDMGFKLTMVLPTCSMYVCFRDSRQCRSRDSVGRWRHSIVSTSVSSEASGAAWNGPAISTVGLSRINPAFPDVSRRGLQECRQPSADGRIMAKTNSNVVDG